MQSLSLHPDCSSGPIDHIEASVEATGDGCRAIFRARGDLSQIVIPMRETPERMDDLWKTTCFEIFWQPAGGSYYREFNLSPSTRWAAYDFSDFRKDMRNAPADIEIVCRTDGNIMEVLADVKSQLPLPADVALNAIIEDTTGNIQFWALAFQEGKAEFHSEVCRQTRLEEVA